VPEILRLPDRGCKPEVDSDRHAGRLRDADQRLDVRIAIERDGDGVATLMRMAREVGAVVQMSLFFQPFLNRDGRC
jgi:hypothetical protein